MKAIPHTTVLTKEKLDLTKTVVEGQDAQQHEYIRASNMRSRCLAGAQLEASLKSANQTLASSQTEKTLRCHWSLDKVSKINQIWLWGKKKKKNRFNGRTLLWTDKFKFELLMDKFDYKVLKHAYNNSYGNCHRKLKDKTAAYCLKLTTTI